MKKITVNKIIKALESKGVTLDNHYTTLANGWLGYNKNIDNNTAEVTRDVKSNGYTNVIGANVRSTTTHYYFTYKDIEVKSQPLVYSTGMFNETDLTQMESHRESVFNKFIEEIVKAFQ